MAGSDPTPEPEVPADDRRREVAERLEYLRDTTRRRGGESVLLMVRSNVAWTTLGGLNHVVIGDRVGAIGLLVTPREAVAVSPVNEAARFIDEELSGLDVRVEAIPWHANVRDESARIAGGGPLLSDDDVETELRPRRSVLAAPEQARLRWLSTAVRGALDHAVASAERGMTEDEASATMVEALTALGARVPVVLAAADHRIARYRHPLPTSTVIRDRLMLIAVAERWGIHAALTAFREFTPASDDIRARFAAVRDVEAAMLDATRPGATLGDVLVAAGEAYAAAGFADELELHHQGGTIGYQPREDIAVPGSRTRIEPGMAFAWNPSITGAKVERTVLLGEDGAVETLTGAPG